MNVLLTILVAVNLALAGADTPLRERGRKALVGPPLRVGSYAALRGGVTTAGGVEINTQIVGSNRLGLDLGDAQVLKKYEEWRALDALMVMGATDSLTRVFGIRGKTASAVRRLGMAGIQRSGWLKRLFMDEARGISGELPELLKA